MTDRRAEPIYHSMGNFYATRQQVTPAEPMPRLLPQSSQLRGGLRIEWVCAMRR